MTRTFSGDQRPKIVGVEINTDVLSTNPFYNTYKWNDTTWETDGTLTGGVAQANFSDGLVGTAGLRRNTGCAKARRSKTAHDQRASKYIASHAMSTRTSGLLIQKSTEI